MVECAAVAAPQQTQVAFHAVGVGAIAGILANTVPHGLTLLDSEWTADVALGAVTETLPARLLGSLAIAVCALAIGVPVWTGWWFAWRG